MKKIIFAFAILLLAIPSSAQFKATKDGFLAEDGKNFYVAVVEGKSAMDLYKGVNAYIISNFKNPDAVANRMDGEMINMHASIDNAFVCKKHVQRGGYAARGWGGVMVSVRRSRTINQSGSRRIRSIPFQCRARSRATLCRKSVA